jgi:hypothetical protein
VPPRAPQTGDLLSMAEKQGEMFEAVRATKHAVANISQKMDAVSAIVQTVEQLNRDRDDHERRLAVLEADKHRREGAIGLVEWVSRHWPITILIAAATMAWAFLTGKLR